MSFFYGKMKGNSMNEAEKRRMKLLNETRRRYEDTLRPPAVHPRYRAVYEEIYPSGNEKEKNRNDHFGKRILLSFLLFALFFCMERQNMKVEGVDSKRIIQEVEKNMDTKDVIALIKK